MDAGSVVDVEETVYLVDEFSEGIEQKRTGWLEPMAEWIKEAGNLPEIARESNLFAKKVAAKEIFGSNLVLANREARLRAPSEEDLSGGNAWAALCAANEKVGQFSESQIVVPAAGIEPTTSWSEARRSIQLSYAGTIRQCIARGIIALCSFITPRLAGARPTELRGHHEEV